MRRALTYIVVAAILCTPGIAAEHKSWSKIRYVGGTIPVKASPYDWNTTLTVSLKPDSIVIAIAPAAMFTPGYTLRISPSQVTSLSSGPAAGRRVGEVSGAQLPKKPPALFGLLQDNSFLGIVYQDDKGKPEAILLDSRFSGRILSVLKTLTGKTIEDSP